MITVDYIELRLLTRNTPVYADYSRLKGYYLGLHSITQMNLTDLDYPGLTLVTNGLPTIILD